MLPRCRAVRKRSGVAHPWNSASPASATKLDFLTKPCLWTILTIREPKWRNGIRGGLKHRWGLPRVGSNPTFGTYIIVVDTFWQVESGRSAAIADGRQRHSGGAGPGGYSSYRAGNLRAVSCAGVCPGAGAGVGPAGSALGPSPHAPRLQPLGAGPVAGTAFDRQPSLSSERSIALCHS